MYDELFFMKNINSECYADCVSAIILGADSNVFTYFSEAHGITSWIDHCIPTGQVI